MGKVTREEYERILEEAGDSAEQEADHNLLQALIDERLNALSAGGS